MFGKSFHLTFLFLIIGLVSGTALSGVDYGEPEGGWTYIYTCDTAAPDLDGTWDHDNGSDQWDESEIGAGRPGGVSVLTEDGTTFIRLQEPGDPRDHGMDDPGSNRKLYFTHDLTNEIDQAIADDILSTVGITLSFRARIPTTPPLDDLHADGGSSATPWPAEGNGYGPHNGGKSVFGIHQEEGGDQTISFALALANDDHANVAAYMDGKDGLNMNALDGTSPSGAVDAQDNEGTANILELDPTQWHEFWITIEPDTSGGGTHKVNVYADGSSTPTEFHVTAGDGGDESYSYVAIGSGGTPQSGAIDADFFAYKEGIITPIPSNPNLARAIAPPNGATVTLADATPFAWTAGESAVQHDVYFGTVENDVNNADITDTTGIYQGRQSLVIFTPSEAVELGQSYFWRIDEVEADSTTIHKGDVWSFSTLDHIVIEDFEIYDTGENQIWFAWHDGLGYGEPANPPFFAGNGTGAAVGDETTNSFAEETIVHGGRKSMPFYFNNNKQGFMNYSEATKTLTKGRDWTEQGVKALSLWFRGFPAFLGGFVEVPAGTYTVTAEGADIWGSSDQFHFAWQQLTGAGSIKAKVESVQDTDPWAKAGLMIRDTLDADSAYGMVALTPGNGVWFGRRTAAGNASDSDNEPGLTAPYWIRLERTSGGLVRAYYSPDDSAWTQLGSSIVINMNLPTYIGLAVTSHNPGVACEAVFSNVTSDGTGAWINQDIGMNSNEAAKMYVEIANNNGTAGIIYHDNPEATLINTWTEWNIDLRDFSTQGVDLTDVNSISVGLGDKANPQPGGSGKMFIDDISLYQPRYVPDKVVPLTADFTDDGIVNYSDLEIMVNDWLMGDFTRQGPLLVHYTFDEGDGTLAADSSSQGSDGTLSGSAAWDATGKMGAAASFDGGLGEVRGNSPYLNGLSAISFGAWIKSNATDSDAGVIIFTDPTGNDQRDIRYDSAGGTGGGTNVIKYGVSTEEGSHENESAGNVQTTEWQHVMVTWNSGEAAQLYINGVLDTPSAEADVIGGTTTGYTDVIVGRGGKDAGGSWDGLVDDVRVYEVALTAQQVQTVMNGDDIPSTDTYVPLTSVANISDDEPANSKSVNFKDYALLADEWLQQLIWPAP